jgi:hypothetical protein
VAWRRLVRLEGKVIVVGWVIGLNLNLIIYIGVYMAYCFYFMG